ncbi:MAG: YpjP family protein [Tuberibacillus sp.]
MPRWFKKTFVTLVAILTLGTVVPTVNYHSDNNKPSRYNSGGSRTETGSSDIALVQTADAAMEDTTEKSEEAWSEIAANCQTKDEMLAELEQFTKREAEAQGFIKFGDGIARVIGGTYTNEIVPKFADVVSTLGAATDADTLRHLAVSHNPAGGTGERIMHLYDERTGEEWVKFHVRRDHPPLDGYYFTFHYHTKEDNFQNHYEIGKINWGKNTPPKWMA